MKESPLSNAHQLTVEEVRRLKNLDAIRKQRATLIEEFKLQMIEFVDYVQQLSNLDRQERKWL